MKWGLWWDSLVQSWKYLSLKFTRKLCVMGMRNDAIIEEELTSQFKISMSNLTNFDSRTQKSQKIQFNGCLWSKYIMFDLKMHKGVIFDSTEYWCKIWMKTEFCFQKWHEEFRKFSPETWKSSIFELWWDSFKSKIENVWH